MKTMKAMYAFSGDPITFGHIHIIERADAVFSELIVGIGNNPAKKYMFSQSERFELAKKALARFTNIRVVAFKGLLTDYAYEHTIPVIIRGLRNIEDYHMELMMHQIGESQNMGVDTLFFPASQKMSHISSGAAKALQLEQGFVYEYVPLNVKQKLEEKISGQFIVGITGEIASGKSHTAALLAKLGEKMGIPFTIIDIDKLGHQVLESLAEPVYHELRTSLVSIFGEHILDKNGYINKKQLGTIIFSNPDKLKQFNEAMYRPVLLRLRRELYGKRGLIILDSALIAESGMSYLCNNNIIVVSVSKDTQLARLKKRGLSDEQITQRMNGQYSYEAKISHIKNAIEKDGHGKIYSFDSASEENEMMALVEELMSDLVHSTPEKVI